MARYFVPEYVFIVPGNIAYALSGTTKAEAILAIADKGGIDPFKIGVIQSVATRREAFPRDRKLSEFPLWIRPKRKFSADHSAWLYRIVNNDLEPTAVSPLEALDGCSGIYRSPAIILQLG